VTGVRDFMLEDRLLNVMNDVVDSYPGELSQTYNESKQVYSIHEVGRSSF
jgi:hypothetical protein